MLKWTIERMDDSKYLVTAFDKVTRIVIRAVFPETSTLVSSRLSRRQMAKYLKARRITFLRRATQEELAVFIDQGYQEKSSWDTGRGTKVFRLKALSKTIPEVCLEVKKE